MFLVTLVCFCMLLGSLLGMSGWLVRSQLLEVHLGLLAAWSPPLDFDAVEASSLLPHHPNVWTDGSLVLDRVTGVSSAGAGFFAHQPGFLLGSSVLGSC